MNITFPSLKSARFFFDHLLEGEQDEAQLSIFSSVGSNLIQTWQPSLAAQLEMPLA